MDNNFLIESRNYKGNTIESFHILCLLCTYLKVSIVPITKCNTYIIIVYL